MLSGVHQIEKDKYHDFTYMWNLEKKIQKQTHRNGEHFDGCQMGGELGRWVKRGNGSKSTNW